MLQDTYVANGANSKTNYGYATTLNVATSPVNQDLSSIAMLKFDLTEVCAGLLLLSRTASSALRARARNLGADKRYNAAWSSASS